MAVAVLVLKAFTGKCRTARRSTKQEAARAHIGCGPDEVRNSLETEHRVVDEERNRVDAMRGIRRSRSDERAHRSGFGDAFLEDLAVLRFFVIEQRIYVDGFILLADAGINSGGAEKRFHAEGAGFVGNDGHDELADFRFLEHLAEHAPEAHRPNPSPPITP